MSWTIKGINDKGHELIWTVHSKAIVEGLQNWLSQPLNLGSLRNFPETDKHFVDPDTGESIHVHRNWLFHISPNQ